METKGLSGAEALLRLLGQMGVERIFASPGSEWAPVWEYLAKPYGPDERIPAYLSSRHEEVAVGMASGYAKVSGKLPAVMLHTTAGSLKATMALRGALHEQVPMVVLAGESIGFGEEQGDDPGQQWLRLLADVGGPARPDARARERGRRQLYMLLSSPFGAASHSSSESSNTALKSAFTISRSCWISVRKRRTSWCNSSRESLGESIRILRLRIRARQDQHRAAVADQIQAFLNRGCRTGARSGVRIDHYHGPTGALLGEAW